jgi:hypothetical protein
MSQGREKLQEMTDKNVAGYQCDHVFDWTIIKYQQLHAGAALPRNLVCETKRDTESLVSIFSYAMPSWSD